MVTLVIGHRGTGKTTFLSQLKESVSRRERPVVFLDLDEEISRLIGTPISEIFASQGEAAFRELEQKTLQSILKPFEFNSDSDVIVSLGAGYLGEIPDFAQALWLSRPTDVDGRIFLNRPRLNPLLSPLEEYRSRWQSRSDRYKKQAFSELQRREGETFLNIADLCYLGLESEPICTGASLTLLSDNLANPIQFKKWMTQRLSWDFRLIELRTDLLNLAQMEIALRDLPKHKTLVSFRGESKESLEGFSQKFRSASAGGIWIDWDLDLGDPPEFANILSLHSRSENLNNDFQKLESHFQSKLNSGKGEKIPHLKFSPEILNFKELELGYQWWNEDKKNRSFLPRSTDGKWSWFRLWMKEDMALNFVREGQGSASDQPTITEWAMARNLPPRSEFGAVIGSPVLHSWSPVFHESRFRESKRGFFRIQMDSIEAKLLRTEAKLLRTDTKALTTDEKLLRENLEILVRLGARAFAVTSPLKRIAAEAVSQNWKPIPNTSLAINTIAVDSEKWWSTNTDEIALKIELSRFQDKKVVMWGAGGMSDSVKRVLPSVQIVSAREGCIQNENPEILIWGVGRAQMDQCKWPPENWQPKLIYDLNYSENSPGLEYALTHNCDYVSGARLFRLQAMEQQKFWQEKIGL